MVCHACKISRRYK